MNYSKKNLRLFLICMAEGYANAMLEKKEKGEKINPYEISMFCSLFGIYQILGNRVSDIYKLHKEDLQVLYGLVTDINVLKEYWITSDLYRATKIEMTGYEASWCKGEFNGIFTFINKVRNGIISEEDITLQFNVQEETKLFCTSVINIVDSKLVQYLLLNHASDLVKRFEGNNDVATSVLTLRIDSSFRLLANVIRNETNYLNCDMSIFNKYVELTEAAALFFYNNIGGNFFKEEVPIVSEEYLNKAIAHVESSKVKYEEIGDDLKTLVKAYVENGGNPATLISYINSIS